MSPPHSGGCPLSDMFLHPSMLDIAEVTMKLFCSLHLKAVALAHSLTSMVQPTQPAAYSASGSTQACRAARGQLFSESCIL